MGERDELIIEEIVDLESEDAATQRAVQDGFAALQHERETGKMPPGYERWDDEPEHASPRALAMRIREVAGKAQGKRVVLPGVTADDLYHLADAFLGYDPDPPGSAPEAPTEAPAHAFPLWCVMETGDAERPFHGPFATEAAAEREAAGLGSEGYEVTVRRCRRLRASESTDMEWRLQDLVDAIDASPGDGKIGEVNVYVIGSFDVPWVRARKGANLRLLDRLLEVDAYEVKPEGATS